MERDADTRPHRLVIYAHLASIKVGYEDYQKQQNLAYFFHPLFFSLSIFEIYIYINTDRDYNPEALFRTDILKKVHRKIYEHTSSSEYIFIRSIKVGRGQGKVLGSKNS